MAEIWKSIKGYEGIYQISSIGRVKSLHRVTKGKSGNRTINEKIMSVSYDGVGYEKVTLSLNGKTKTIRNHRLVATSFIPCECLKTDINHINGIKSDNRVENLEWCTKKQNQQHALRIGLIKTGINNNCSVIDIQDIREILILLKNGVTQRKIASKFNVSQYVITSINRRKRYANEIIEIESEETNGQKIK